MGNFAEVLRNNQAYNINKFRDEIGKKLGTFNNILTAYNKAKTSTWVATVSTKPNKAKARGHLQLALTSKTSLGSMPVKRMMVVRVRMKSLILKRVKRNV